MSFGSKEIIYDGNIVFGETIASPLGYGCALDSAKKIGFVGGDGVFDADFNSFTYDTDADFTYVADSTVNGLGEQIALDTTKTPPLIFVANQLDTSVHSYDTSANLTHVQTVNNVGPVGVVADTGRNLLFIGNTTNNPALESFAYADSGTVGAQIDEIVLAINTNIGRLAIDTDKKLIFAQMFGAANQGLFSYSYDNDGDNLTEKDQADSFVSTWHNGSALDTERLLVFHCSDSGLHVYSYDAAGTFSAALSSETTLDYTNAVVDTNSRLIFCAAKNSGVYVYKYAADGTSLTLIGNDDKGGEHEDIAFDNVNGVLLTAAAASGSHTYTVT